MPLRIELAPHERLIVGGASIRNGSRRVEFVVETQARILRERDIITERDADTPCKLLYVALEMAYLSDDPVAAEAHFMTVANRVMLAMPDSAIHIAGIFDCMLAGDYYKALKIGKRLVSHEATCAAEATGATGAACAAEPDRRSA